MKDYSLNGARWSFAEGFTLRKIFDSTEVMDGSHVFLLVFEVGVVDPLDPPDSILILKIQIVLY